MTMPRRGSHPIAIDGVAHRWRLTRSGEWASGLRVELDRARAGGALDVRLPRVMDPWLRFSLEGSGSHPQPDEPGAGDTYPVTGGFVRRGVLAGLRLGWVPGERRMAIARDGSSFRRDER